MTTLQTGDRVRVMEPTKVANGFVDCSTVLTVVTSDSTQTVAYWTDKAGRQHNVLLYTEVDKVA